jgi:hypothetical protein
MLANTHKLISKKVSEIVKSELNISIDLSSFKSGSIAPDLYPKMRFKSHDFEGVRFVLENIDALIKNGIPGKKKDIKKFSFRLGIITHFISDCFCKAHNGTKRNFIIHYMYERRLKKYFIKKIKSHNPVICIPDYREWQSLSDIESFIDEKHQEYNSLSQSMSNDLIFSLEVSLSVILCMLSVCARNPNSELFSSVA